MKQPSRPLDVNSIPLQSVRQRTGALGVESLARWPETSGSVSEFIDRLPRSGLARRLTEAALALDEAVRRERTIIALVGADAALGGCSALIAGMIRTGMLDAVAVDGAAAVADFELAYFGQTGEDRATDQYGSWREPGDTLNTIVNEGAGRGFGLGEYIGRALLERGARNADISIFAHASAGRIPATVHPRLGADPMIRHPSAIGANWGKSAQRDFLLFAGQLNRLDPGGLILDLWSGGLGGVFEEALAAATQAETSMRDWSYVEFGPDRPADLGELIPRKSFLKGDPLLLSLLLAMMPEQADRD